MSKSTSRRPFHAFTDTTKKGERSFTGKVDKYKSTRTTIEFAYTYDYDGIEVTGEFSGEHLGLTKLRDPEMVQGTWSETSEKPIGGAKKWGGSADLFVLRMVPDRTLLVGTWTMVGYAPERWVVDVSNDEG